MRFQHRSWRPALLAGAPGLSVLALLLLACLAAAPRTGSAQWPRSVACYGQCGNSQARIANQPYSYVGPGYPPSSCNDCAEWAGEWYWLRSPEQERRFAAATFNRYCIRCHGVDGRGAWDIPGVPNFANARWQAFHSDTQLARAIEQGLGAVMPPFRGTLTLEEACAMARYVRTFVPGSEASRPDYSDSENPERKANSAASNEAHPLPSATAPVR